MSTPTWWRPSARRWTGRARAASPWWKPGIHREPVATVLKNAGWDLAAIQSAGGQRVVFENTRNRGSWGQYRQRKVPWGGFLFPAFELNGWYDQTNVFVSLGKMKNHAVAGVTMTVKNLFGITPTALYGDDAPNEDSVESRAAPRCT